MASWLIRNGIGPGGVVGIYMDRSMEMLVSVLAVMKAGAAYIPLDPKFPRRRIEQIIEETEFPVLLTLARHMDDLPEFAGTVLCVDSKASELAKEQIRQFPSISGEMLAYIIFTSGSTGKPKGVEITHGAVVNLLLDLKNRLEVVPEDRLLAVTTLSFDISVLELMLPLVSGGTVIIATQADAADGMRLMELLDESQATMLQATPFTWKMLLELDFVPNPGFKMLCGGEAWPASMGERLLAAGGRLWNMYGPTETTVWSSVTEVQCGATSITIGPPIAHTRLYVLDGDLQTVPDGIPGELFIAGKGVARGYFKRPELTAERFLEDPFAAADRMYRTGDEVRRHADGRIEFVGRLDQQVKLRGFRIELGEIEAAMSQTPGIKDAVVVLCKDSAGDDMLAGYYISNSAVLPARIRESLQETLPFYMVPKLLERLEGFPLTPNGKTDRRALSERKENVDIGRQDMLAGPEVSSSNASTTEQLMLSIWRKIFEGVQIGSDSNFFDIGGDSLSLVRLQSMVTRQFGVHLTMSDITRHATFGLLTAWVENTQAKGPSTLTRPADPRVLPVNSAADGRPIFLLPQMMIFWPLAEELGVDQTIYALQLLDEDIPPAMATPSFAQLAALYCKLIREVQPEGPYRLGGWCLWALMSYEVARLLEEQGQEVELLMMIDSWAPGHWTRQSTLRKILMTWAHNYQRLNWMINRLRYASMERRKQDVVRRIRAMAASVSMLPKGMRPEEPPRESNRVEKLVSDAAVSYIPKPIRGTVAVFRGEQQPAGKLIGDDLGWSQLLGRKVAVDTLPGNHSEIFDLPGARIMAARIRKVLNPEPSS
ncbi:MAG: amino acid adenylation domain-containing protein [Acidobacteria bacterium]|nr:amino acid adenylation domain-containing protein [Acidobacteriota bacterium]